MPEALQSLAEFLVQLNFVESFDDLITSLKDFKQDLLVLLLVVGVFEELTVGFVDLDEVGGWYGNTDARVTNDSILVFTLHTLAELLLAEHSKLEPLSLFNAGFDF